MADSCANCRFSRQISGIRSCHVDPPQRHALANESAMVVVPSDWPTVLDEDWCGEHKPAEPDDPAFFSAPVGQMAALEKALAPILKVAERIDELAGPESVDDLVMIDIADGDGHPMSLRVAEFQALRDAWKDLTEVEDENGGN